MSQNYLSRLWCRIGAIACAFCLAVESHPNQANGQGVANAGDGPLAASQAAREAAQRTQSLNNLKQIGLAMQNHHSVYKVLPARAKFDNDGKPLLSWRVLLLPFLEERALYDEFRLDEPWDSEHNKPLLEKMPKVYADPRVTVAAGTTAYQAVVGPGTVFDGKKGMRMKQITDGTSATIFVVEASADKAVPWTKPDDWEFDPNNAAGGLGNNMPGDSFGA